MSLGEISTQRLAVGSTYFGQSNQTSGDTEAAGGVLIRILRHFCLSWNLDFFMVFNEFLMNKKPH